jgi:hypothetical protein
MSSSAKPSIVAPEPDSVFSHEREQRKQIPQTSKASNVASSVVAKTLGMNVEDQIRERAYELYLQRGSREGQAEQDWLDAEYEILANR